MFVLFDGQTDRLYLLRDEELPCILFEHVVNQMEQLNLHDSLVVTDVDCNNISEMSICIIRNKFL